MPLPTNEKTAVVKRGDRLSLTLKTLTDGSLILTSDHDTSLTIISHPGTEQQTASFVTLPAGSSGLDDAIIPATSSGTFYVANGGAGDVLKVAVTGLNTHDIYLSVGSDNAVDQLDPTTGKLTPFIVGLNSPHGLLFVPSASVAPSSTGASVAWFNALLKNMAPALAKDLSAAQIGKLTTYASDLAHGIHTDRPYGGAGSMPAIQIEDKLKTLFAVHSTSA